MKIDKPRLETAVVLAALAYGTWRSAQFQRGEAAIGAGAIGVAAIAGLSPALSLLISCLAVAPFVPEVRRALNLGEFTPQPWLQNVARAAAIRAAHLPDEYLNPVASYYAQMYGPYLNEPLPGFADPHAYY